MPILLQAVKRQLDERSDAHLLADFLERQDQEAFERLPSLNSTKALSTCLKAILFFFS